MSELASGGTVLATDELIALRSAGNVRVTVGALATQDTSNITLTGGNISGLSSLGVNGTATANNLTLSNAAGVTSIAMNAPAYSSNWTMYSGAGGANAIGFFDGSAYRLTVKPSGVDVTGDLDVTGSITADVTGNVTGNVTGSAGTSSTAATVTTAAQPAITSVGTLSSLTVTNPIVGSITGNAATATSATTATSASTATSATTATTATSATLAASATKLATARTIDITGDISATAVAFDGTANIAISATVNDNSHTHNNSTVFSLDASKITTGTISDARLPATISSNVTGSSATCTGNAATATAASNANYASSAGSANSAGTVTTAAQPSITSVGTLSSLLVGGNINTNSSFGAVGFVQAGVLSSTGASKGVQVSQNGSVLASTTTTGAAYACQFFNPNGFVGRIETNGSTTAYVTTSDPRVKSTFVPITGALDMVEDARDQGMIGEFHFLADPSQTVWGYNAHKLIDNQPTFGGNEGQGDRSASIGGSVTPAGVDQSKRVPILEAAIGELLDRIKVLEANAAL